MNFVINIDPFHRDLIVCFGSKKELRKTLLEVHQQDKVNEILAEIDVNDKSLRGRTIYNAELPLFAVWMPNLPNTAEDFGFMVHELFHATCATMAMIGAQPSDDTEEVYAYLLGFLTQEVLHGINLTSCACGQGLASKQMQPKSS